MNPDITRRIEIGFHLAALVAAFFAGWEVQSWRKDRDAAQVQATQANARADGAEKSLTQFKDATSQMTAAATSALDAVGQVRAKMDALKMRAYATPLPTDCRPDVDRLRARNAAIDAYNAARVGPNPGK